LQLPAAVATPAVQPDAPHAGVPAAGKWHCAPSKPSQLLVAQASVVPPDAHAARGATGAPPIATHVPDLPATLHEEHCSVHAVLQHTPSTQLPDSHSPPAAQAMPRPRRVHRGDGGPRGVDRDSTREVGGVEVGLQRPRSAVLSERELDAARTTVGVERDQRLGRERDVAFRVDELDVPLADADRRDARPHAERVARVDRRAGLADHAQLLEAAGRRHDHHVVGGARVHDGPLGDLGLARPEIRRANLDPRGRLALGDDARRAVGARGDLEGQRAARGLRVAGASAHDGVHAIEPRGEPSEPVQLGDHRPRIAKRGRRGGRRRGRGRGAGLGRGPLRAGRREGRGDQGAATLPLGSSTAA
jgi:hypothetical protein